MKKKAWIILVSLLAAAVIGLNICEYIESGTVDTNHLARTCIILPGLIVSYLKMISGMSGTRSIKTLINVPTASLSAAP